MTPPSSPPSGFSLDDPKLLRLLRIIAWMVILGGGACALVLAWPLLSRLIHATLPFAVALVFAYMFDPLVTFVQKRLRLSRVVGMIVFYLFVLVAVGGFFVLLLPALYRQTTSLLDQVQQEAPQRVESLLEKLDVDPVLLRTQLDDYLTSHGMTMESMARKAAENPDVRQAARQAATGGLQLIGAGFRAAIHFFSAVFSGIGFLVLVVVANFYLLLDFSRIRNIVMPMVPKEWRPRTLVVSGKLDHAVGGFLRGQVIDCVLVGVLTTIGLMALGLGQYAILIGFITGVANFIPYLGPLIGGTPAVLMVLLSNRFDWPQEKLVYAGLVIGLFALVQTIDGFVFQPKIVGKSAQLHPLAVMIALVIGAQFGLMGMIVAVPLACIVRVFWKEFYWDERDREWRRSQKTKSPA